MKIIHLVDYLMPTMGYQEFLLPKWNLKQGCEVVIITSDRYQPIPNYNESWKNILGDRLVGSGEEYHEGVKVIRLPVAIEIKGRPWIKGVEAAIKKENPDIIFCHGTGSFSIYRASRLAASSNIPLVADNHMIIDIVQEGFLQDLYYFFHKFLMKRYLQSKVYKFIGVTDESSDYLHLKEGIDRENIQTIPLGVDTEIFNLTRSSQTDIEQFKLTDNTLTILQSGKLNQDKKPQWLAQAVCKLLSEGEDLSLAFIGGGDAVIRKDILELFKKTRFSNRIFFKDMKNLKELADSFSDFDIVAFPEGTSLSALEAAACGTSVIMADHPASLDRENNGIGVTYSTGDIDDLSKKIKYLSDNQHRHHTEERSLKSIDLY